MRSVSVMCTCTLYLLGEWLPLGVKLLCAHSLCSTNAFLSADKERRTGLQNVGLQCNTFGCLNGVINAGVNVDRNATSTAYVALWFER